ncbi:hypothetical protein ABZ942_40785 [Nocardia sp. NPDC046473]|uniref:hypothetical protein n=1 Tax=Nocardia sp. NPDC046473 TaxID=3155733 RepID=UPI0033E3B339
MTESIIINPSDVRAAGQELLDLSSSSAGGPVSFHTIMRELIDAVGGAGAETWGDDSFGKQFAEGANGYRASRSNLLKGGNDMLTTLQDFGTGLTTAANNTSNGESGNVNNFR